MILAIAIAIIKQLRQTNAKRRIFDFSIVTCLPYQNYIPVLLKQVTLITNPDFFQEWILRHLSV
jgi:hypothetical protein